MATIQTLDTVLRAITRQFDRAMKKSTTVVEKFQKGVLAAGAAGVAAFFKFQLAGDALHKMSIRTGIGIESLSALKFAAEQSGTTIDQLSQALFRATRRIGNAITATGPAARALKELGLSANELLKNSPEEMFYVLVDALNSLDSEARASQMGFEIFGDNWRQLQPLITSGAKNIKALTAEARALGITISAEQASAAAALNDQWNRMWKTVDKVGASLMQAFGPALTTLLEGFRVTLDGIKWTMEQIKTLALDPVIRFFAGVKDDTSDFFRSDAPNLRKVAKAPETKQLAQQLMRTDKIVESIKKSAKVEKKQLKELKEIKRLEEKAVPALKKGTFDTIKFLDKLSRQEEQKVVGLLEKNNEWQERIHAAILEGTSVGIPAFEVEVIR